MATQQTAGVPLTAAEKRAARRARVLEGGESRLKLVTGQISSLKESESELDKEMDSALNELLSATDAAVSEGAAPSSGGAQGGGADSQPLRSDAPSDDAEPTAAALSARIALRPDPAQRRREAALRRQKKEAMVEQLLAPLQSKSEAAPTAAAAAAAPVTPSSASASASAAVSAAPKPAKAAKPATFSRHAFALRLQAFEEKAIVLVLLAAAVYLAMTIDLRTISTDLDARDPLFVSYQELLAQGLPLASIRQQMEREQLEAPVVQRIERLLAAQLSPKAAPGVSLASSLVPNVWDVPAYFASLVAQPPVVLCVLLVRLAVAALAGAAHVALRLPDVRSPQDDDFGFVANLALASKPALKGYVVKVRKALDDVFVFLYALLVAVALRAIYAAHVA